MVSVALECVGTLVAQYLYANGRVSLQTCAEAHIKVVYRYSTCVTCVNLPAW